MNGIVLVMVSLAFVLAGWRQLVWVPAGGASAPMELLSKAMIDAASGAVTLAIGLVGVMTLFMGLMKVAEAGGMLRIIARLIRPLMIRLFPDVPPEHPAMGAMILNLSANALGLGNAATPFGIRAMQELDKLNSQPGTATNAMVLFLAINTSSVTLLPTGVIALRAAAGSHDPAAILPTTLCATIGSTTVAILAAKLYSRWSAAPPPLAAAGTTNGTPAPDSHAVQEAPLEDQGQPYPLWVSSVALTCLLGLVPATVLYGQAISPWIIPGLMVFFLAFGALRRVPVYASMVEGGREGFQVALRIIPYMVVILVAVAMLRSSGALDLLVSLLGRFTAPLGLPAEALPMALLRPLSGSGAYAVLASLINDPAIGPDSYTGMLVSTLQGSTETTFYVLAVYFGAVQVRRIRHAMAAALTADLVGVICSVLACLALFGK
ncbi:nucleoside recognition domain protein [Desulfobulbus propionicus DSM 2032]|uniref:Nucleoside recognition domain protein n=1 Tax=Desulfobulbus propionicus (strain ATCC 33891 / DSM 2032 / VKM B-1956 / 1pr3) TaxID=577650 RepID=A0A7U3YL70_DESPD|nr:nucleoside recognition domain-containing protein [Desulfobulbus propionicus]ADW17303.1 nucleoside recognition domain protein [Desulfobulbus propionicus DSM 2032]